MNPVRVMKDLQFKLHVNKVDKMKRYNLIISEITYVGLLNPSPYNTPRFQFEIAVLLYEKENKRERCDDVKLSHGVMS